MRERAHVAGALDVVLAAQRIHPDAAPADIAGRHRQIGHPHDRGRALAVLGDAEAVIDRGVAAAGVKPRGGADILGRNAGELAQPSRGCSPAGDERRPIGKGVGVAALAHESFVDQPFGDDDMRQGIEHRDVGAGPERQVICRLDMRRAHQVGAARIDDDQLRALAQPLFHARGEDRMARRSGWRRSP